MEPATGTVSGGAATGAPTCSVLSAAASCPEPLQQHWVSFQERASRAVWEAGAILDAFLQNTHESKASGNGTRAACILLVFFFFPRHHCEVFGVVLGFLGSWLLSCGVAHPTVTLFFF